MVSFASLVGSFSLGSNLTRLGDTTLTETVLEATVDILQVTLTTRSSGVSAFGLLAPVVRALLGLGVSARSTAGFLNVISTLSAADTESVRLVVAATE